jgi:hypothetical protein
MRQDTLFMLKPEGQSVKLSLVDWSNGAKNGAIGSVGK